jgi:YhcH/YjgK/YiaL family protein
MKTILSSFFAVILFFSINATSFAQVCDEEAYKWFQQGSFLNGLTLKPHESINKTEFYKLYKQNPARWDKAFAFLKNTNLDTIRPGKYPIDGDAVFASVTFNPTKAQEQAKWEYHKKYTDIQYVISGKEKMGQAPIANLNATEEFNATKDLGFGTVSENEAYYEAVPGTFLIFFPADAHRPGIHLDGCDKDKKIVIKVQND